MRTSEPEPVCVSVLSKSRKGPRLTRSRELGCCGGPAGLFQSSPNRGRVRDRPPRRLSPPQIAADAPTFQSSPNRGRVRDPWAGIREEIEADVSVLSKSRKGATIVQKFTLDIPPVSVLSKSRKGPRRLGVRGRGYASSTARVSVLSKSRKGPRRQPRGDLGCKALAKGFSPLQIEEGSATIVGRWSTSRCVRAQVVSVLSKSRRGPRH